MKRMVRPRIGISDPGAFSAIFEKLILMNYGGLSLIYIIHACITHHDATIPSYTNLTHSVCRAILWTDSRTRLQAIA